MAAFATIAALMTLLVLGFVLAPLWRTSRGVTIGAVIALSLSTFALYRIVGTPAAIDAPVAAAAPRNMQEAVSQLEADLERNPNQVEGWRLLAKSYTMLERPADARDAAARAARLSPDDADLLVEAAQARLYASADKRIDGEAVGMLRHALELNPAHQRARWFIGIWLRQNGHPAEAAQTWQPLLAQVDAKTAQTLLAQINDARGEAKLEPLPASAVPHADARANLSVTVSLDPDFAARVRLRGDATVFVIARAPGGPPMPVAVQKHALQELPLTTSLGDSDSPMPTQKLSAMREVEVIARLSSSGDAIRHDGDLESKPVRVKLPATAPVDLVLGAKP